MSITTHTHRPDLILIGAEAKEKSNELDEAS